MGPERWKVGELARRTGVSVRTLHHYDQIGLLSPAHRSDAGYRLYDAGDVARLQQIKSLRELGFRLEDIRSLLDGSVSLHRVLRLHIERLQERMELERDLCRRLESIAAHLDVGEEVSPDEFFTTLEVMSLMDRIETYYTPEQLAALAERRQMLGDDEIRRVEAEWPRLIAEVRAELAAGTDPGDERVLALARHWRELIEGFTGGDPGIASSLATMYRSEPDVGAQFGLDTELFAYIGKAMAALDGTE